MPDATVGPRADALIAIPPEGARRFRTLVLDEVGQAGDQINEGARSLIREPDLNPHRLDREDFPRLHVAEAVYRQVRESGEDGRLSVTGDPDTLLGLVRLCAADTVEQLAVDLGPIPERVTATDLRSARVLHAELGVWLDLADTLAVAAGGES